MRAPASRQHHWRLGLLMLMLLAGCVRAFVVVPTPTKQLGASRRPTLAPLPRTMDAAAASTTRAPVRRGAPLWIKGQPLEEEKETAADMVRSYAAERQQLVNLGFVTLVAAAVLAKVALVDVDFWRGWTPMEIFFRIPLDNWDGYMAVLTDHPVIVKGVTSCSVYTLGDWVAQMYEGKTLGEIDRVRVARSAVAGLVGHGPLSHLWYGVSEGFFDFLGWAGWWTVFPKITVDQLVWSPIWNGCYIALLGLMKRESPREIWQTVRGTSLSLITSGLKLWPLAHVVTYGLIPVENRLLWVDLVEILWVTILSREAAGADATKEEAAAESGRLLALAAGEQQQQQQQQQGGVGGEPAAGTAFAATEMAAPGTEQSPPPPQQQQQLAPVIVPMAQENGTADGSSLLS